MITLKIPVVSILRLLFRVWQFLGALMLIGITFMILLSVEITFTYEMIQYGLVWKFILLIGGMTLIVEWIAVILFGETLIK